MALSNARALHASYLRLVRSSSSTTLRSEALDELRTALETLDGDLEDLEFSVVAVEESGDRWGVSDAEVRRRRSHLDGVVREFQVGSLHVCPACPSSIALQSIKAAVDQPRSGPRSPKGKERADPLLGTSANGRYRDTEPSDLEQGDARDRDRRDIEGWEQQEQEMIMHKQDNTLSIISGTLSTLAQQAGLIGQEVGEQTEYV